MPLTPVERERIQDSKRKIRSIADTLRHVNPKKIAHFDEIQDCLEDADRNLDGALRRDEN